MRFNDFDDLKKAMSNLEHLGDSFAPFVFDNNLNKNTNKSDTQVENEELLETLPDKSPEELKKIKDYLAGNEQPNKSSESTKTDETVSNLHKTTKEPEMGVNGERIITTDAVLKCPSCGSNLRFNAEIQKLYCDYCHNTIDINSKQDFDKNDFTEVQFDKAGHTSWSTETKAFKCDNCGGSVIIDKFAVATLCPYCGSSQIAETDELKGLKPDAVIPFMFDEKKAREYYVNKMRKKKFVPNVIKQNPPIKSVNGVYAPAFSYDTDTFSTYTGRLGETHSETHRNASGQTYTTSHTHWFDVSGAYTNNFRDVLIESSQHLNEVNFAKIKPYSNTNQMEYNSSFLAGYSADYYDKNMYDCYATAKQIMAAGIRSGILLKYQYDTVDYLNIKTQYSLPKYKYILLPVYFFVFNYQNKLYTIHMNGETGKLGGGVPRSAIKITLFVLFIILGILGLLLLFNAPPLIIFLERLFNIGIRW